MPGKKGARPKAPSECAREQQSSSAAANEGLLSESLGELIRRLEEFGKRLNKSDIPESVLVEKAAKAFLELEHPFAAKCLQNEFRRFREEVGDVFNKDEDVVVDDDFLRQRLGQTRNNRPLAGNAQRICDVPKQR